MSNLRSKLPPLTSLAAFDSVCRHLSFTKAAVELCLTQAAVSRQIIALEDKIGVKLFERRSHGVILTSDGHWFANIVNPAINSIGEATSKLRSRQINTLTLYTEPCIANYWLMPRISRYQALFPETTANLLTSNLDLDKATELFDIGMQYGTANNKVFQQQAIWNDEIIIATCPEIHKQLPKNPKLSDLIDFPLIHTNRIGAGWVSWSEYYEQFESKLPSMNTSLVFNNYHSSVDAALHGAGIILGWKFVVGSLLEEEKLLRVGKFTMPSPDAMLIYTRRNSPNSETAFEFIEWMKLRI
ncbi:MAG: LysR family glycine cleavage system transcriptional activator [Saprospiraceae bacterium]|jgi:LysR family glycine cleavage system transcriptional activator